jgi:hypothetical protein
MLLLLSLACQSDTLPDTAVPFEPTPYLVEEEAPPVPTLDAGTLEASVSDALAVAWTLQADPILVGYQTVMAHAEPGCPDYYSNEGNVYWYDQCTTSDGTRFDGYGFAQVYEAYAAEDGNVYDGFGLYGVSRVTTPDGRRFVSGGSATSLRAANADTTSWQSVIQGTFAWDGADAAGSWMDGELAPDLTLVAVGANANVLGRAVAIEGSVGGLDGPVNAVLFDGFLIYTAAWGSACAIEPGGVVSLRGEDGGWYDVLFDGPAEWGGTADAAACDGCGEAWFRGERVGSVCLDATALLRWEEAPW